jgi:HPt (histidine-containing phosphotransfer) domain-containing protein
MAPRKDIVPSVTTYADHEVITPPHVLRMAVTHSTDHADDPITRAEAALSELSDEFGDWMRSECERLEAARQDVKRGGLSDESHAALFRAAHDLKGEAATFGYPAVGAATESLCRLLEHTPDKARIPLDLLEQHVDGVRAIVREHGLPGRSAIAEVLTNRLREVTDAFLRNENRDRPQYLDSIFAPPVVPGAPAG